MSIYTNCIIIGDWGVGKTSIIMRYINNTYTQYDPTIGVDYMVKYLKHNGQPIKICFWDASGYPSYRSIVRSYYKHALLIILVYDVTNYDSFENLDIWARDVKKHNNICNIILVANKIDEKGARIISHNQGNEYAKKNGMFYIETSAKDDININNIFLEHLHNIGMYRCQQSIGQQSIDQQSIGQQSIGQQSIDQQSTEADERQCSIYEIIRRWLSIISI